MPGDAAGATHTDPVCGMGVDTARSPRRAKHAGAVFYFCGARCRQRFVADPSAYLAPSDERRAGPAGGPGAAGGHASIASHADPSCQHGHAGQPRQPGQPGHAAATPRAAQAGVLHTCPMHPQVRQDGPGDCPLCGMALEPLALTAEPEDNPELRAMTRRLWGAGVLTVPLLVIAMGGMLPGLGAWLVHGPGARWLELALATPVVLWGGWPFFVRAARSVASRHLNMYTLIGLGVGVAYGYSVVAVAAPGVFPASLRDHAGQVGVYFEAAAAIVTLVLLGQVLELRARSSTTAAIRALLGLAPRTARRIAADGT